MTPHAFPWNLWSVHALLAGMLICPVTTEIGIKVPQKTTNRTWIKASTHLVILTHPGYIQARCPSTEDRKNAMCTRRSISHHSQGAFPEECMKLKLIWCEIRYSDSPHMQNPAFLEKDMKTEEGPLERDRGRKPEVFHVHLWKCHNGMHCLAK